MFDVYGTSFSLSEGGIDLVVTDHGPSDGEPVLLIHGFPDSAALWRHQIPELAAAGYRVLAPDVRGVRAFLQAPRSSQLSHVCYGCRHETSAGRARHRVGTRRWARLGRCDLVVSDDQQSRCSENSHRDLRWPSPCVQRCRDASVGAQLYVLLFQSEGVAEEWLARDDWQAFRQWSGNATDFQRWVADLSRPGALTAALNVYRANMTAEIMTAPAPRLPPIRVPRWGSGRRVTLL